MTVRSEKKPIGKNILLVFSYTSVNVTTQLVHTPPMGIGYLAAFLLNEGHSVKLVDLQVQPRNMIFQNLNYDIIGISILTPYFNEAVNIIKEIRSNGYKGMVIIGGAHPTALPEQSLRETGADLVCIGEGEAVMVKVAAGIPLESISGLGWIENGEFRHSGVSEITTPLDGYPSPSFHLFELDLYGSYNMVIVPPGTKDGIIMTSRGCPYACDFCFKVSRRIRFRTPENIVSEIIALKKRFGYTKFSFIDDCFNANIKRAKEICRRIIHEKIGITFTLPNGIRANLIDEELAALMKKAGCIGANIGVESWDDEVRGKINKQLKREEAINAVKCLRKHGIICTAYFIMGHYHDTAISIRRSLDAIEELDADFYQFSKFIPMPGSPIYNRIMEEGRIRESDFSLYSIFGDASLMDHPVLSQEQIDSAIKIAYRKAALRLRTAIVIAKHPVIAWNVLRKIKQVAKIIKLPSLSN